MRIITEISGAFENKIVYEKDGKVGLFALPAAIYSLGETRKRLYEIHSEDKPNPKHESKSVNNGMNADDDRKCEVKKDSAPDTNTPSARRKIKGKDQ